MLQAKQLFNYFLAELQKIFFDKQLGASQASFRQGGKGLGCRPVKFFIFLKNTRQEFIWQRHKRHNLAAGQDGWQDFPGLVCRQDKQVVWWWFLQGFQKAVCRLPLHCVDVFKYDNPVFRFQGREDKLLFQFPDLANFDCRAIGLHDEQVRMVARQVFFARFAVPTSVIFIRGLAINI